MGLGERVRRAWSELIRPAANEGKARRRVSVPWNNNQAEPTWEMVDSQTFIEEGYNRNSNIYAAIRYKADAAASAELRAYSGDRSKPKPLNDKHPLSKLLRQPNMYMDGRTFQSLCTAYLNIAGNCYIVTDRFTRASSVVRMYTVRPDRMRILFDKDKSLFDDGWLMGYLYLPTGSAYEDAIPFLPEDVGHIKFPSLNDDREGLGYGLSPLFPAAQSGDVDNKITTFLKNFFDNGALFSGYLKFDVPMDSDQVAFARERWMDIYGGVENWHKVGILDQGGEYKQLSPTFDEMGFDSIDERNETRILAALRVPPILIGTRVGLQRSTYSNYEEARRAFWEDGMLGELSLFEAVHNRLLGSDDTFIRYDTSNVPALRRDNVKLADAADKLIRNGVPRQRAFEIVGLDVGELPEGDVAFLPSGYTPIELVVDPTPNPSPMNGEGNNNPTPKPSPIAGEGNNDPTPAPTDGEGNQEEDEKRRQAIVVRFKSLESAAKKVDRAASKQEPAFAKAARDCFDFDLKNVLAIVGAAQKAAMKRKSNIFWWDVETDVLDYLEKEGAENWRETFVPLIEGTVYDVGQIWATELGIAFNIRNLRGEEWFKDYTLVFSKPINQTTSNHIQTVLAQGQAEGWSIPTMQKHLEQLFQQYMKGNLSAADFAWFNDRMPPHRTEMIARTETIRAAGAGAQNLYKEWGVQKRAWLATNDDRTRPTHVTAGQTYGRYGSVGPLPMDEPFMVGGYEMMHPGDASLGAPPEEFIDCRCTIIPIVED